MKLRSATGVSALSSYLLWLPACCQGTECSKWLGCLFHSRHLLGAKKTKWKKTWPLPSGSLKSPRKDLWCGIFFSFCWNTKIHLRLMFLIPKAPNNCPPKSTSSPASEHPIQFMTPVPMAPIYMWLTEHLFNFKVYMAAFRNPRTFSIFSPLPSNTKRTEKINFLCKTARWQQVVG